MPTTTTTITVEAAAVAGARQPVAVTIVNRATGEQVSAYTTANGSTAHVQPATVTTRTTFHLATNEPVLVSAMSPAGQECAADNGYQATVTDRAALIQCVAVADSPATAVLAADVDDVVVLSRAEYTALPVKAARTMYMTTPS